MLQNCQHPDFLHFRLESPQIFAADLQHGMVLSPLSSDHLKMIVLNRYVTGMAWPLLEERQQRTAQIENNRIST
jgi:hypothetical protein